MGKWKKILKWAIPAIAVIAGVGIFGYLKLFAWNPERQKIAVVNNRNITVAQFSRELGKIPSPYQEMLREEPDKFLEQLVLKEVLLQEARSKGIQNETGTQGEEADASQIQKLLKKEVLDKIKVGPEEVEAVYRQHKSELGGKSQGELAPLIENAIREAKGKDQMEEYIGSLKEKAKIEIDQKHLQAMTAPPPPTNTVEEFRQALKSGKPVLVDFGANNCLPCRQMRPVLKEIEKEYNHKAQILVIDVYKYKQLSNEYKVQAIPTFLFFDKTGKEIFRHMGAWDKESIVTKLKEAGAA